MTKAEFKEKHPNGMNAEIARFLKALNKIMTTAEIDRLINSTTGKERKWLVEFKKTYAKVVTSWDVPIWQILVPHIKSPMLLKDVIAIMVSFEKDVYNGENEDE